MADRVIKPDDTNDLVLQNNDGSAKIEVNEAQNIILTGGSTTALTIDASGNATFAGTVGNTGDNTITSGNLAFGTADRGIDFSGAQTAAGGTTDEVLSGYEKGTWSPSASDVAGGVCTFSESFYLKIGALVFAGTKLVVGANSDASGVKINLPFTSDSSYSFGGFVTQNTNSSTIIFRTGNGGAYVYLKRQNDADWTYSNLASQTVAFSLIYHN